MTVETWSTKHQVSENDRVLVISLLSHCNVSSFFKSNAIEYLILLMSNMGLVITIHMKIYSLHIYVTESPGGLLTVEFQKAFDNIH